MTPKEAFGKYIRRLREEKKKTDPTFSLRGFAKEVELSPTFISKMEKGDFKPPSPEKIVKMAEVLGVNQDELLARADKVSPEIPKYIQENPVAADLLRMVRDTEMTPEDIKKLTEQIKKDKNK